MSTLDRTTRWLSALALTGTAFAVHAADVTIAYQTTVEPAKVAQADGAYEKASGAKIDWRKFESGAEVITAVASGDVQIGYVGSSPLAAAASRSLPIQTFLIAAQIGSAEALVVRNGAGIAKPADLAGKKIAVPFVSTTHYSLLAALKHWKIDPSKVQIVNLRPSEITAAWQRGDIDAAYVWDPALGKAKENGKVLVSSTDVAKWGAPTFDAWIVRKDFAEKNPRFVEQFARVTLKAYADYAANPKAFAAKAANVEKIARVTGSKPEEVAGLLTGNRYPLADEQARLLADATTKALTDTSAFLKDQGKVDALQPSYASYVSNRYAKAALK
ncbi:taurine ABC transporter substrate-binding protein [Chitiniphilus eburneus]|uniref:Taurine ABC transporter substrate-binding protein n=1 Tax=Chitiniphilus eburneus TaxID=2571148 RepID=A0A4V5MQW8_9NEIS|nr:taurine ABC transporter substrate-binding protein [Chitiniphilus eburneus]TJZ74188.1 taurine ABC transporter substrate-binding protein [Chitiniphilus eburneus]